MRRELSPRVRGLVALTGFAGVAALASGRPELAVLATPFLVFIGTGLVVASEPDLTASLEFERERVLEGQQLSAMIRLRNRASRAVEVDLTLLRSRHLMLEPPGGLLIRLAPGESTEIGVSTRADRWGAHTLGPVLVRARDPLGILTWRGHLGTQIRLRAFPREERLRQLVAPLRTQPFLGAHVARTRGDGIEFADIRPFAVGDRVRQIHWRTTARRGAPYVTERHPEHASDVVLLLDTFEEARDAESGTLDVAVRAAASLARGHLGRRDRVALVDFGGTLHWLEPAFGTRQLYRIVDALLASEIAFSYAWRAVESIPRRLLPPGAMVLAITPLLDERSIRLIVELRTRGCDLTVVEVSPITQVPAGSAPGDVIAHRLWRLERDALRARLRASGIAIAVWDGEDHLAPALEEVNGFRRSMRPIAHA